MKGGAGREAPFDLFGDRGLFSLKSALAARCVTCDVALPCRRASDSFPGCQITIVVIIGIRIYRRPHPDAVIGLVSHSPDIGDTAFIKGFGIAIRAIVFVVNAMLFRPPVAGFVS